MQTHSRITGHVPGGPTGRTAARIQGARTLCVRALLLCGAASLLLFPMGWAMADVGQQLPDWLLLGWLGLCVATNLWLATTVWLVQDSLASRSAWLYALLALIPTLNLAVGWMVVSEAASRVQGQGPGAEDSASDVFARFGSGVLAWVFGLSVPRHTVAGLLAVSVVGFLVFTQTLKTGTEPLARETPVRMPEHYLKGAPHTTDLTEGRPLAFRLVVRVRDEDERPVRAKVEVWYPDADGGYSDEFRGRAETDARGAVEFRTAYPGHRRLHVLIRQPERQDWAGTLDLPERAGTLLLRDGAVAFFRTHGGDPRVELRVELREVQEDEAWLQQPPWVASSSRWWLSGT